MALDEDESITINICSIKGSKLSLDVDLELSIEELKYVIESEWEEFDPEQTKLVHKGKVLKNDTNLRDLDLSSNNKIVVVKSKTKKKKKTPNTTPTVTSTTTNNTSNNQPTINVPPANGNSNPMGMGSLMGMMGQQPNIQQQMQRMRQNPEMMQQMMQNPMVQSMMNNMMSNPEFMESMFENNPQLRSIMEQNPQIRQILQDPETLQQAMRAASNPEYYNDMMRNHDRAIANISNMPGGFDALARMYNSVQAPMEEALYGGQNSGDTVLSQRNDEVQEEAMPNPWANNNNTNNNNNNNSTSNNNNNNNNSSTLNNASMPFGMNPFLNMNNSNNAANTSSSMNSNAPNPFASLFGGNLGNNNNNNQNMNNLQNNPMFANLFQQQQQYTPPANPQETYRTQLQTLNTMGFTNETENINALNQGRGNLQAAINILMGNRGNMY